MRTLTHRPGSPGCFLGALGRGMDKASEENQRQAVAVINEARQSLLFAGCISHLPQEPEQQAVLAALAARVKQEQWQQARVQLEREARQARDSWLASQIQWGHGAEQVNNAKSELAQRAATHARLRKQKQDYPRRLRKNYRQYPNPQAPWWTVPMRPH